MTLVIDPRATPRRLLWAHMFPVDLSIAKESLRDRERISRADWLSRIGSWQLGCAAPAHIPDLPEWAEAQSLDAAIWTALGPRFRGEDRSPSINEVIGYLRGLDGPIRERAKRYVERTPRQIDTDYRCQIEAAMGWLCKDYL